VLAGRHLEARIGGHAGVLSSQAQAEGWKAIKRMPLNYELDTTKWQQFNFLGYTAEYKPSQVSGNMRLYYNRNKPWSGQVRWYRHYHGKDSISVPTGYIVSQSWYRVIERLQFAGVVMNRIEKDTVVVPEVYRIEHFQTTKTPYEGHYLHYDIKVTLNRESIPIRTGDYYISTQQPAWRFIVETLEPTGEDSFFAWNFFDGILMQKEWFSSYVFEDIAAEMLATDQKLRSEFEVWKRSGEVEKTSFEQLYWLYKQSPYYEPTVNRYPVYRIAE
jgi:hypothetical protein